MGVYAPAPIALLRELRVCLVPLAQQDSSSLHAGVSCRRWSTTFELPAHLAQRVVVADRVSCYVFSRTDMFSRANLVSSHVQGDER